MCAVVLMGGASAALADTATSVSSYGNSDMSFDHACAVSGQFDLKCWGDNTDGQLGDGTTTESASPVQAINQTSDVTSVSAGGDFTCDLRDPPGDVECWGGDSDGQLGDGRTGAGTISSTPVAVSFDNEPPTATQVVTGADHACALVGGDSVFCWGDNDEGQLGTGNMLDSSTSVRIGGLQGNVKALAAGGDDTCAILTSGAAECWGANDDGEVGNGQDGNTVTSPTPVSGLTSGVTAIATSGDHTCAIKGSAMYCWGAANSALGIGNTGFNDTYDTPQQVVAPDGQSQPLGSDGGLTSISAFDQTTCAVDSGAAYCWGSGELGNGTTDTSNVPEQVSGLGSGVAAVSGGCATTTHGVLQCWGDNPGNGSFDTQETPVTVTGYTGGNILTVQNPGTGDGVVSSDPSGIQCGDGYQDCSAPFTDGSTITLSENPAYGSYFSGFSGGGCSGSATTCTISNFQTDITVAADFTAEPKLQVSLSGGGSGTVTSSPAGISCGASGAACAAPFAPGTTVTLTASPGAGSIFTGLRGGGCSGTAPTCAVTLGSDDVSVSAGFDQLPSVSVTSPDDGAVFAQASVPGAQFACTAGAQQQVSSCDATVDGAAIANGAKLPSGLGSHTMVVTATDVDGGTASQNVSYDVQQTVNQGNGGGSGGGPSGTCASQPTLMFGIVEALGCLQAVTDPSQIPEADSAVLCDQLKLSGSACTKELASEIKKKMAPEIATGMVRVNGLDFLPRSGADLVLDPARKLIASSDTSVEIMGDRVSLYTGKLQIDGSKGGQLPQLQTNLDQLVTKSKLAADALNLGGFGVSGTLGVVFGKYQTTLTASVKLPNLFESDAGTPLTLSATAIADDQDDDQFNELLVTGPTLNFKAFKLSDDVFCYQNHVSDNFCQAKTKVDFGDANPSYPTWNVTAKVKVLSVTIDAVPPPPTYGIGFVNGQFAFAGAEGDFADPGIPIGNGVLLTRIGGSVGLDPTRIFGTIGLNIGTTVGINGSVFLVVPENGQTYQFTGTELGNVLQAPLALPKVSVNNFAIAAGGTVLLKLGSLGMQPLASGYVLYAYPSYVAAGGEIGVNVGKILIVRGSVQGAVNFASGEYDIDGQVLVDVNFGILGQASLEADATVSSIGLGACGSVKVGKKHVAAGAGYKWGGKVDVMLGSCSLSAYHVAVTASLAQAASAGVPVKVPAGLPSEMIQVLGDGGAPDVTVTGPGGQRASSAGQDYYGNLPFVIRRDPADDTTWVAIVGPRSGVYRISANPGSPPIAHVLYAQGFTPQIRARVSGRGAARRLHYRVNAVAGEKVSFIERGQGVDRMLGSTTRSHGTLKFHPSPGPGGVRQIIAIASENGTPLVLRPGAQDAGELPVAGYRASGPRRLGRVRALRGTERSSVVKVSFKPVRGGGHYAVLLTLRSGMRTQYEISGSHLQVRVPPAGPAGGTISVLALGDRLHTVNGPVVKATVRLATRHPKRPRRPKRKRKGGR